MNYNAFLCWCNVALYIDELPSLAVGGVDAGRITLSAGEGGAEQLGDGVLERPPNPWHLLQQAREQLAHL